MLINKHNTIVDVDLGSSSINETIISVEFGPSNDNDVLKEQHGFAVHQMQAGKAHGKLNLIPVRKAWFKTLKEAIEYGNKIEKPTIIDNSYQLIDTQYGMHLFMEKHNQIPIDPNLMESIIDVYGLNCKEETSLYIIWTHEEIDLIAGPDYFVPEEEESITEEEPTKPIKENSMLDIDGERQERLERHYEGKLIDFKTIENEVPKMADWLMSISQYEQVDKYVLMIKYKVGEYKFYIYSNERRYNISLILENHDSEKSYCGATMSNRKSKAGEYWTRGNDLPDGEFNDNTLERIKNAIIERELVPLEI